VVLLEGRENVEVAVIPDVLLDPKVVVVVVELLSPFAVEVDSVEETVETVPV
jgi:hypothetical protein